MMSIQDIRYTSADAVQGTARQAAESAIRRLRDRDPVARAFVDACMDEGINCPQSAEVALQLVLILRQATKALRDEDI